MEIGVATTGRGGILQADFFHKPPPPLQAKDLFSVLRPYQQEAINKTFNLFQDSRSALTVFATGCGKTLTFCGVAERWLREHKTPVLIVAHRQELIDQAARQVQKWMGISVGVEMGDDRAQGNERIIVASKDSLHERRLQRLDRAWQPGLIIVDEAHHCIASNESYMRILNHWGKAKVLGVTATPDRSDEVRLGEVFDDVCAVYEIDDAIRDGWLVPVKSYRILVENREVIRASGGEFNQVELDALMHQEGLVHDIVQQVIAHEDGRKKSLVFCTSIANAHLTEEVFNHYLPGSAASIDQNTEASDRKAILASHQRGDILYVTNVGVLCEGYDDPSACTMVNMAPTKSRARYAQKAGRVTRPLEGLLRHDMSQAERIAAIAGSAKPYCTLLNAVDGKSLKLQADAIDILGGKSSEEVVEKAKEIAEREGGDVMAALSKAQKELEKALRANMRRRLIVGVQVKGRIVQIDPFAMYGVEESAVPQERNRFGWKPPTEKMVNALRKYGIESETMSFSEARTLLDKIIGESRPTVKMLMTLTKNGIQDASKWTFDEARAYMQLWADQGWKKPNEKQIFSIRRGGQ